MHTYRIVRNHIIAATLFTLSATVGAQATSAGSGQATSTGSGQATSTSSGQAYPNKPIRVIVPFAPGGANDITIRTLNIRLPSLLGQSLIIDNRPGAGGNIGAEITAKSPPDGYTLLIANNSLIINASLYRKLPYDPFRDFAPISMTATSPTWWCRIRRCRCAASRNWLH